MNINNSQKMEITQMSFIHHLKYIWVVSTFRLLLIFAYKYLCGHMFPILLGIYLGVGLLGYMVTLCLMF